MSECVETTDELDPWPLREIDGWLWAATNQYEHPDTGRKVWLTGMVHVAERAFYEGLREQMVKAEADGWQVQYEMLIRPNMAALAVLDPGPQLAARLLGMDQSPAALHMPDLMGLVTQHVMDPPESWVNADIDAAEMVRLLGDRALPTARKMRLVGGIVGACNRPGLRRPVGKLLRACFMAIFPQGDVLERVAKQQRDHDVVIDRRNQVGLDAMLTADTDVWASWGAGHVPGLHRGLVEAGYELVNQEWALAIGEQGAS